MPINTILATAAAAILLFGPAGGQMIRQAARTPAAASLPAISQQAPAQPSTNCASQLDDATEADSAAADTDTEDLQCGDQNAPDAAEADTESEAAESDQNDAAPSATPAITADQARATAEAQLNAGAASKVELDDENGQLVYSVEIGGVDVKVDAMTGVVVTVESGQDSAENAESDQDQVEEGNQASPDVAPDAAG
ncbi:MAG: PepSY domain-containing protein [Caldilinea sp.]|nr:PepSY domain-containing protein [Caldilineaceae bacterium]MCO5209868.1 PepSY domain-containing protein [Caldilinea sp.]MCW5844087.1 PepSY domain-containing protein [Caldilinea sp.]